MLTSLKDTWGDWISPDKWVDNNFYPGRHILCLAQFHHVGNPTM